MNDWNYELQNAVRNGDYDGVKETIKHGANVNYNDGYVLRWASTKGHFLICDYLVSQGADPQKVVDDEYCSQENKQWAIDFVNKRNFANKLTNELDKPSKADKLVASIDENAEAPTKQAKSTRQKI
ncbi:hypothetical protein [Burkholderia contaminans]|uniref:hypothetical protein n=1 Tax=Burkholderia contaminans TaxID=488447 RepID=UPI0015885185|nr:hypothetical protein [Burkholderia contaminans]